MSDCKAVKVLEKKLAVESSSYLRDLIEEAIGVVNQQAPYGCS